MKKIFTLVSAFSIFLFMVFSAPIKTLALTTYVSPGDDVVAIVASAEEGDTILFAPGTYNLGSPIAPAVDNLTLAGSGASVTNIYTIGNAFELSSSIDNLTIEGFTIISVSGADGIYCNVNTGTATGSIFNNIIASQPDRKTYVGIYLTKGCSFEIYNNTISKSSNSGITLSNIRASNNIYSNDISSSLLGINLVSDSFNANNILIHNNNIHGNYGGIYTYDSTISIYNNGISNNLNTNYGGGIALLLSKAQVYANKIYQNQAIYGAGIYMAVLGDGSQIYNNYISANSAVKGPGGGIYSSASDTPIYNNTIVNNTASGNLSPSSLQLFEKLDMPDDSDKKMHASVNKDSVGGGVYFESNTSLSPLFYNNIVWGNPDAIYYVGGATPLFSYNDMDEADL